MPRDYDVVKINPNIAPDSNEVEGVEETHVDAGVDRLTLLAVIGGGVLLIGLICWGGWFFVGQTSANEPTPTQPVFPPTQERITQTATLVLPSPTPPPAEPPNFELTATFEAAINRPASGVSENHRILVGAVTLQPGCNITNIGFDASGSRYYLHMPPSMIVSINPDLQLAEVRGIITLLETCRYPIIQVQSFTWINELATPSPLITDTSTLTQTDIWRHSAGPTQTPQPGPVIAPPPQFPRKTATPVITPWPTHTPYPTPTPFDYIPTQRQWPTPEPWPTYTPYPTPTAWPTYTPYPTPATQTPTATDTFTPTATTPPPTPTETATLEPTEELTAEPTVEPTEEP